MHNDLLTYPKSNGSLVILLGWDGEAGHVENF